MSSIYYKISEIKNNLITKDIKAIQKEKLKIIKDNNTKDTQEKSLIKEYNYYVKLIRKIKKHIKESRNYDITIITPKHQNSNLVAILSKINTNEINIGISIDIRLLSGNQNESYMDCTYYENQGVLYINDFRSTIPNNGYGKIILNNLNQIIYDINVILIKNKYKYINAIRGKMIANRHIISEENLRKIYIKYEFEVDNLNNITKNIKATT